MENIKVNVSGPTLLLNCIYKTVVLKENLPLSELIVYENTKYVIKWNFDLKGTNILIPEGCLIEFDGGSISNGSITCNDTIFIYNQAEEVVLKNVELTGNYEMNVGGGNSDKKDNINGMGKITLKKNKEFSEQIIQNNTTYIIKYNFDLNNESITIPKNCVLEFDGGSVSNGTLTLSDDTLITAIGKAFGDSITIVNGSHVQWNILWFGARSADGSIYDELTSPVNGYTPYEFLIPEPENDIAPVILRMFDALCYDIYIPKGNYYWGSTVRCDNNVRIVGGYEKISHDHVIMEGYWRYDDNVAHDYFPRESIKVLRRVETMLFIGDPDIDEIWATTQGAINHRRSLTFSHLNIKCYKGSMTAILNGWIDGAEIHDNNILDCGYLVDYPADGDGVQNVPLSSGLWKVPKIYNNFVGLVHGAVFRCNVVDGFIHDNYFSGNGCEIVYDCEHNSSTRIKNHSLFVDCYHWNNFDKVKVCNNFIDYFYVVYRLTYNCDLTSSCNQYDVTSCVFNGMVYHVVYELLQNKPLEYLGIISSVNDNFSNINNWEWKDADWTFDNPFPSEKDVNKSTRSLFGRNNSINMDGAPVQNEDGYYDLTASDNRFITNCYSIFLVFPKELTFIPASLLNVDYIFQGKEYKLREVIKTHYIIGGRADNFHYSKIEINNSETMLFVPVLDILSSNISIPNIVINKRVNDFIETESFNLEDPNLQSKAGAYRSGNWSNTYVSSIKTDFSNMKGNIVFLQAYCSDNNIGIYRDVKMPIGSTVLENLVPNTSYNIKCDYTDNFGNLKSLYINYTSGGSNLRLLNIEGTENVRDLGGWACDGGHVRYGVILRGGGLDYQYHHLSEKSRLQLYDGLRCRLLIDIVVLSEPVRTKYIDRIDVSYVNAPIDAYNLVDNKTSIKTIVEAILGNTNDTRDGKKPSAYIHCNLGRDRTGTVCIILLAVLGVSESDILKDYDVSSFFYSDNNFANAVTLISSLKTDYPANSLMGSAEAYLNDCGLSAAQIANFKEMMVEANE